ncbi:hypothetical protein DFO77_1733 [Marinilabilia salmonicolor]|uniref:Uncharacterized protein n=1 Tax=Marinilabilia salmonicolor TaxID=989 RepID=A0A368UIQ9_9BACT|nr:hypothetical protein DFO77_1762 [Marinilabilia salmonicolor]RCW19737.1 hypothetical protein DFO77_1733 [Marinilabilia salmonicolor]
MRSAGAIKPATIVSSRERVARKNEACNMLWSPGWRIQIVCALHEQQRTHTGSSRKRLKIQIFFK